MKYELKAVTREVGTIRVERIFYAEKGEGFAQIHLGLKLEHGDDQAHWTELDVWIAEETIIQSPCEAFFCFNELMRYEWQ